MTGSILLVEDEALVGTLVVLNLEGTGHRVRWVKGVQEALKALQTQAFDLVLLDIALPDGDGLEVLHWLRTRSLHPPVMMLTARGDLATKVRTLEGGADDYLPKPFDVPELLARVTALLRRAAAKPASGAVLRLGAYAINLDQRVARGPDGDTPLSPKEAALLRLFAESQGRVIRRADLLEEAWGMDAAPTERTVDNFILKLRKRFEPDPDHPRHFLTVRGEGYRFEP